MSDSLEQQLAFLREIDGLKRVIRATPVLNGSRNENSAEHSWHLAVYALVLADHAPKGVDIGRVVSMLLVHDIVEIDAGDVPIHGGGDPLEQADRERLAADRIFGMLPTNQGNRLRALWDEFETVQSPDAAFAKSLDRMQPLMQNIAAGGGTWNDHALSEADIHARYGPQIACGSQILWARAQRLVAKFFRSGTR